MAILGATQFLERLQFFNGQRLLASDLQSLESFNREMRWLHNQSLHQPGIGSGYAVSGNKGDRQVTISPGYAIDACGREIVLTEIEVAPIPPVADDGQGNPVFFDLAVSYPLDADLSPSERREGICLPEGVVKLREAPNFCWLELGADFQPKDPRLKAELQSSMRILLARAEIKNCQLNQPLSVSQRRNARPPSQPHIACGSTDPKAGGWSTIAGPPVFEGPDLFLGMEIDVDTSSGRFQIPPSYSAQIMGERIFSASLPDFIPEASYILDGYTDITDATARGFTLRLVMPVNFNAGFLLNPSGFLQAFSDSPEAGNEVLAGNQWSVVWMGVES